MKKILSIMLAVCLIIAVCPFGMFSITANASTLTSGYYSYVISYRGATITDCDTSISGNVTIPSKFGSFHVTSIDYEAFSNCTSLTSITIPDSVTSIGHYAFRNCSSLTSITIPDSVTSIGGSTFYGCSNLTNITIPDSVTSIGGGAFYDCFSLTSITIPDSVTSISYDAFYNCSSLTSITIPDSVTSISDSAFSGCSSLTSITIPDSVTSISFDTFRDCINLANITIPDSVSLIDSSAFYNTSYYNDAGNWENGVLYIGKHLIAVNKSITGTCNIKPGTKTIAYGAFEDCSNPINITIPDSFTSIGDSAFSGCSSLTSITIPDSVTSIGAWAFYYCSNLKSITIPDSVIKIGNNAFYNCLSLKSITLPNSVTSIAYTTFRNCRSLTSITIPDSVTIIVAQAFQDCSSLKSITIPNSVTSIGEGAFRNCNNLENIYYHGTKEQWNKISISSSNTNLTNATRYYHKISNWQTIVEPTCSAEGEKYAVCSECSEEITEVIPSLGHDYSDEYTIDKEATDFEEGSKSRHCSRCDSVTDVIVIPKTSTDDDNINSTHLVELRKALLVSDNIYNLAMDFNNDGEVNVKDLVRLKKILASKD